MNSTLWLNWCLIVANSALLVAALRKRASAPSHALDFFTPAFVDGAVLFFMAGFTASQSLLDNDEAYKYVDAHVLFWMRYWSGFLAAGFTALKAFRTVSYKPGNGHGQPPPVAQQQLPPAQGGP